MAQLSPRRRAAVLVSSLAVIVSSVVLLTTHDHGSGVVDGAGFVTGLIIGVAAVVAFGLIFKSWMRRRAGG